MNNVVLSLFPGAGLLDMGFQEAGFCIVRGPDILFGQDIKDWDASALAGKIGGVIGGVPCQKFSSAVKIKNREKHEDLWSEFWRVVGEVRPDWCLAENVYGAMKYCNLMFDVPEGYINSKRKLNFADLGSAQVRSRMIMFGRQSQKLVENFWKELGEFGKAWGEEWREKIGRVAPAMPYGTVTAGASVQLGSRNMIKAKYKTVTGDSLQQKDEPVKYLRGDELLDAFDLPVDFNLDPKNMVRWSKGSKARLITQGVPVAAAYALATAVKMAALRPSLPSVEK